MRYSTYAEAAASPEARRHPPGNPLAAPLETARVAQNRHLEALVIDPAPVGQVVDETLPGPLGPIPVRWTWPLEQRSPRRVLHIRGGGWWTGTFAASTAIINQLANDSGCVVGSIDYRSAPRHRYPAQLDEVMAVLEAMRTPTASVGADSQPVLFGESAGASLCLAAAQRLRAAGLAQPAALVQFYSNALGPPANPKPMTEWIWNGYLPSPAAASDPGAVPLRGDVSGLAPMWVGVGEDDHLLVDSLEIAARCAAAGVACELRRYPDMPHGFLQFVSLLEPARQALQDAAEFIRDHVAAPARVR